MEVIHILSASDKLQQSSDFLACLIKRDQRDTKAFTSKYPSPKFLCDANLLAIAVEWRRCNEPGRYDYVEVRDGGDENAPLVGKHCGKIAPSPVLSTTTLLFIKFVSDYETHGAGFSIRYEVFKTGPECSRNFTTTSGVIKSPGFPEKYPNNLDCTYMIFAPKMAEIIVEFESFELEPDTTPPTGVFCRYDRLEIWDGFPGVGPHIGRFCGQNTPGRFRTSTGILAMTLMTDNAIAKEGFSANFTVIEKTVPEDFDCLEPLGMESGEITSDQIMCSSQYNANWSAEKSRLNYIENAWTPAEDSSKEWIQIFQGNTNHVDVVKTPLPKPILTRFIRIRPTMWENGIALRFEVYGCKNVGERDSAAFREYPCSGMLGMLSGLITDGQITASNFADRNWVPENARLLTSRSGWALQPQALPYTKEWLQMDLAKEKLYPCSGMLGMLSGLITDGQITASNFADRNWVPENARLLTSRSGWALQPQALPYTKEWLQVDLAKEKLVRGLIIQGGRHRENKVFMRKFKIGYSNNGSDWKMIIDANGNKPKTFEGNSNYDTPELRTFEPLLTRFIRVYPERAASSGLGLRIELLGCEIEAPTLVPTTTAISLIDECDDDQANCHSGTGDDYDLPGGGAVQITDEPTDGDTSELPDTNMHWFNCDFGWGADQTMCGWQQEGAWRLQSSGKPTSNTGPNQDHTGVIFEQVVMEAVIENSSWGDIALDDVNILDDMHMGDCRDLTPEYEYPDNSSENEEIQGNMLKTLDPILITIIAMSALGVFLGAICGVVLYCACSHGGMAERNLSALENYNFELVDGVKLKKDKLNSQNSYSEA
ncbi:UNVERIFIED_CONTAM: hypothetical protein FKN15_068735 [Acipenser sinensis]